MAKEERILQMAEDARRKDDRYEEMLERLDKKDKQMNELIQQVAAINSNSNNDKAEDITPSAPQRPRAAKRKAEQVDSSTGEGSGENGEMIPATFKHKQSGDTAWTAHRKFNFPIADNAPFNTFEISWDDSWPADKKAYYTARKAKQVAGKKKRESKAATNNGVVKVKREPTKAQKVAALKKQLEDLEK